jgi:methyl-accepting chemotaxis protein
MEIVVSATDTVDARFEKIAAIAVTATELIESAWTEFGVRDEADVEKLLVDLLDRVRSEGIQDIYLGYESTGAVAVGSGWQEPDDYDARTRPWYKDAVAAGRGAVIFTEPYYDPATEGMVISVATTVYDESGTFVGAMGTDVSIKDMSDYVEGLRIFGKGSGIMLLESGVVAAGLDDDKILKADLTRDGDFPEELRSVAQRMVAGETGNAVYHDGGEARQMFFAPTERGFYLGVVFPVSEITAMVRGLTVILLLIAAGALLVTAGVIFGVIRGLTRSIRSLEATTTRLGSGDLTARYDERGRDELARIARTLNGMIGSLGDVLSSIGREADGTAERAKTLSSICSGTLSSMQDVARSVDEVQELLGRSSSALEETNASIEEIAAGAQSSARATAEGAEGVTLASDAAEKAAEEVDVVIGDIRKAEGESNHGIERIRELARSVDAISGFVTTITSIADQTNLLALNAAIEAARAGEAGRGFAVVAEEVRKLAEESARAAQEVNKLIDGLQHHSSDSIRATESTGRLLEGVLARAGRMQQSLLAAVGAIGTVTESVQTIAAVSQEQAAAAEEVTSAVQGVTAAAGQIVGSVEAIHGATEGTTGAAETIAQEAGEMAATAERLQAQLGRFILTEARQAGLVPKK